MRRRFVAGKEPKVELAAPPMVEPKKRGPAKKAVPEKLEGKKPPSTVEGQQAAPKRRGTEIQLSNDVFDELEKFEKDMTRKIEQRGKELKWDPLKTAQVKRQLSRVVRLQAIQKSMYARMTTDTAYRRKIQEPTTAESVIRAESSAQKQEAELYRMMGLDEMHEAKVGQVEAKSKPTDLQVIVGGNLSKKHMAAGGGSDGDDA